MTARGKFIIHEGEINEPGNFWHVNLTNYWRSTCILLLFSVTRRSAVIEPITRSKIWTLIISYTYGKENLWSWYYTSYEAVDFLYSAFSYARHCSLSVVLQDLTSWKICVVICSMLGSGVTWHQKSRIYGTLAFSTELDFGGAWRRIFLTQNYHTQANISSVHDLAEINSQRRTFNYSGNKYDVGHSTKLNSLPHQIWHVCDVFINRRRKNISPELIFFGAYLSIYY